MIIQKASQPDLSNNFPHTCFTAAGCLIHEGKVLLIKHKKLGIWLNPGGHIDEGELPHEAAEREFYEETGVFVEAYWTHVDSLPDSSKKAADDQSETREFFTPNPITSNLHWVSEKNYLARLDAASKVQKTYTKEEKWQKGCEQHLNFLYLVRPLGTIAIKQNKKETDGIDWFTLQELEKIEITDQIRKEVALAFRVVESL